MVSGSPRSDRGASAVEFALVLPLLLMFLFGIIQYGYGLFQLQALSATADEATQKAATGISDCGVFSGTLRGLADGNGLDVDKLKAVQVQWRAEDGTLTDRPDPRGQAQVTVSLTPLKIGFPLIPFPDTLRATRVAAVQSIGDLELAGCSVRL